MSTTISEPAKTTKAAHPALWFGDIVRAERIKFFSLRSTWWTIAVMFGLGAGLTALVCATSADWLASGQANEDPHSFVTWGMSIAQIAAVVLGVLMITGEYATGMIRSSLMAMPRRSAVLAAKALILSATLFVVGTVTAVVGYFAGNYFLDRHDIGIALSDSGMLRSLYGSGLYVMALGLFSLGAGLLLRHTAAALSTVLAVIFVVGNMVFMLPGAWGEWIGKLIPGQSGSAIAVPVTYNPDLLGPWPGYTVFVAETAIMLTVAYALFARRDA